MKKLFIILGLISVGGFCIGMNSTPSDKPKWDQISQSIQGGKTAPNSVCFFTKESLEVKDKDGLTCLQVLFRDMVTLLSFGADMHKDSWKLLQECSLKEVKNLYQSIEWLIVTDKVAHAKDSFDIFDMQYRHHYQKIYGTIVATKEFFQVDIDAAVKYGKWGTIAIKLARGTVSKAYIEKLPGDQKLKLAQAALKVSQSPWLYGISDTDPLKSLHDKLLKEVRCQMDPLTFSMYCNPYKYGIAAGAVVVLAIVAGWKYYQTRPDDETEQEIVEGVA